MPIAKGKKILVTGPNANTLRALNGGWSYTWQGNGTDEILAKLAEDTANRKAKDGGPFIKPNTIYEALCKEYGAENVTLDNTLTYKNSGAYYEENLADASMTSVKQQTQNADIIIACVGENSYTETPGNLTDLNLSENQRNLVKALASTGKPVVLVLNEGRPRIVSDIEPLAKAVVDVMLPSNNGGDALAALLSGRENFSGKLPFSYPRNISAFNGGGRHYGRLLRL